MYMLYLVSLSAVLRVVRENFSSRRRIPANSSAVPPPLSRFCVFVQMVAMRQYQVVGRKAVTEKEPNPPVYRMKVTFAFCEAN